MRLRSTAGANRLLSEAGLAVPPGPTSDQEALRVVRSASLLSEAEIEAIGVRQRKTGMPFHEAASDLGLLDPETFDLLIAQGGGLHLLDGGDPRIDPLVTAAFEASSPYVAKVRAVRAKLLSASSRPRSFGTRHRLALISVNGDDEAAILAANLAVVLAQMDGPTVVIDANVEEPSLDRLFRLPNRVGLAEQIVGATLDLPIAATAVDALWLMPAGQAAGSAAGLLEKDSLAEAADRWSLPEANLLVFLAERPRRSTSFGHMLQGFDAVALAARRGATPLAEMRRVIDDLDGHGIPVAGAVLS